MNAVLSAVLLPVLVLIVTPWLTDRLADWLGARAILDHPVDRSSHRVPVPRGGGLAVIPVLLAACCAVALLEMAPLGSWIVFAGAAGLALLSWQDDRGGLSAGLRLGAHATAVLIGILVLPSTIRVFQGLFPLPLDRALAALLWVWFVNLYNFMDGIDGITGTETACLGFGVALVLAVTGHAAGPVLAFALCAAAAALGFLRANWHPARIFLGDVGSVPLGYVTGWLLLLLAGAGHWVSALILPLCYLADASITLLRRIGRGERFWRAHREHYYQRALAADQNHAAVVRIILAGNVVLIGLALFALILPLPALALAVTATAAVLLVLQKRSETARAG